MMKRSASGKHNTVNGFTLIEVLVAIAVVAFTIPALMLSVMKQADNAGVLRNKTIAAWIAQNTATRLRLERKLSGEYLQNTEESTVMMAGGEWYVRIGSEQTELGALLRYRIMVGLEKDQSLVVLDTFVH